MLGLIDDAKDVLLALLDGDTEYCADALREIYDELESASRQVLESNMTDEVASTELATIARQEDLNGRIRRNMMDATLAFININQNKIIKIFSVAAVALLPPALTASIYGMNFANMPELNQFWGYPFSLALMVCRALVPMWYFRRRGWLK